MTAKLGKRAKTESTAKLAKTAKTGSTAKLATRAKQASGRRTGIRCIVCGQPRAAAAVGDGPPAAGRRLTQAVAASPLRSLRSIRPGTVPLDT